MHPDDERMLTESELRHAQDAALDALEQIMNYTHETGTGLEFTTGPGPITRDRLPIPLPPAPPETIDVGHAEPGTTTESLLERARAASAGPYSDPTPAQ